MTFQDAVNKGTTPKAIATAVLLALIVVAGAGDALAQATRRKPPLKPTEPSAPAIPIDKRDSVVSAPGLFNAKPYWLALAQCGGIYFKLNVLYTDIAVHARVGKPDPTLNNEVTKKLIDAVLLYNDQARAAGDRIKGSDTSAAILAGLSAAKACPVLYQACQAAYP